MSWRRDLRAALPAWLIARVVVIAVFLIVRRITETHVKSFVERAGTKLNAQRKSIHRKPHRHR